MEHEGSNEQLGGVSEILAFQQGQGLSPRSEVPGIRSLSGLLH